MFSTYIREVPQTDEIIEEEDSSYVKGAAQPLHKSTNDPKSLP